MTDFEQWWEDGSTCPHGMDPEDFFKCVCESAWRNGAIKERERAALKVEELGMIGYGTLAIAVAIRKGDQE